MTTPTQETLYAMALTRGISVLPPLLQLYQLTGSATAIFDHRNHIEDVIPDISPRLKENLCHLDEALRRAEEELNYDQYYGIQVLTMADNDYPQRLLNCDDAPLVLYYKGSANLNTQRIINIVGTRKCTAYGQDLIRSFVQELSMACPNVLIVSGLAYGVDIHAHRHALQCGLDTVGVLAHGLDDLYPPRHRDTAAKMLSQGGLLTEHMTCTNADKVNFVRRNRIVAGMSDACVLVESAAHGGGLITARLSREYNRDVYAFPGRIGDLYSEGCNNLIRDNGAQLITSADDMVRAMGWQNDQQLYPGHSSRALSGSCFLTSPPTSRSLWRHCRNKTTSKSTCSRSLPICLCSNSQPELFEMEMKGIVRTLAGGSYHLILNG